MWRASHATGRIPEIMLTWTMALTFRQLRIPVASCSPRASLSFWFWPFWSAVAGS